MELKEELIEKVERYLSGKLTREEVKEDLDSDLSGDELDEAVELFETSKNLIELNGLREDLKSIHEDYVAENEGAKTNTRWIWITLAVAATALLIAVFSGVLNKNSPQFEDYFIAYQDIISMRGSEGDINQAMQLYSQGNYAAALDEFASIESDTLDNAILFYQAVSALAASKYDLAVEGFERLSQQENNTFWQQTTWYLALAYWQQGQLEKAKTLLAGIEPGQYNYNQARELAGDL